MIHRRQFILALGGTLISPWFGGRAFAGCIEDAPAQIAPVTRVFGVGGCGCRVVDDIRRKGITGIDCSILIGRAAERRALDVRLDSGIDCALSEIDAAAIQNAVRGAHRVFVVTGLGGKTGTQIGPLVAKAAQAHGVVVAAVVIEPFGFPLCQYDVRHLPSMN